MVVTFDQKYLKELYVNGQTTSKKHRFQPDVIARYVKVPTPIATICNIIESSNHYH